jgi:hypothetical protein
MRGVFFDSDPPYYHVQRQQPVSATANTATTSCDHRQPSQPSPARGRHCHLPPPCPQPPVHPGPRYPSSPNSTREYYSSSVPLRMDSRERKPSSTARRSHPSDTTPATHTVPSKLLRQASTQLAFMVHGCNLAGRCERSIDSNPCTREPCHGPSSRLNLWDFVHTPLMISSIQPTLLSDAS